MRNKAALKKKRDEEDNRRHKEKEQIKKELRLQEKKDEKSKIKNKKDSKDINAIKKEIDLSVKKEIETESSQVIMASGTTTANSTPKTTPSIKVGTPLSSQISINKEDGDNKKRKREDGKTDPITSSITTDAKKIKTESK